MNTATQEKKQEKKQVSTKVKNWQAFELEIKEREQSIANLLPQHISKQRFITSAVAAVKQNPDLLKATPRSLMAAITKSAQDGLLPDGREGVITIYREKQKDGGYEFIAQWNPMTYGLRKRARELDGIIINAQVVHENDIFLREEGDEPKIEHRPASLGQDRGKMIGAYAIFRNDESGILHREVMDEAQIETVRAQSKAPDSLMWTKFTQEGWRKTVLRRGIKSVPVSEPLETIVRRDDDLFDFNDKGKEVPKVIQPSVNGPKALPPVVGEETEKTETEETEQKWISELRIAFAACATLSDLSEEQIRLMVPQKDKVTPEEWTIAEQILQDHLKRLNPITDGQNDE